MVLGSINARLAVDTEILLPNLINTEASEPQRDYNYKVCYRIKLNNEKEYAKKILKLDENKQYGYGMTKPLPTGCIKENLDVSWRTFNLLLEKVSLNDQIGHLYVVDIEFDHKNATENQTVYNEIYPPIIEKQKIINPSKGLYISRLSNIQKQKKVVHKDIKQLQQHTRPYSIKSVLCI